MKTFRISGRVIDATTGLRIKGLRVEAWDKDLIFGALVGTSQIDFLISFSIDLFLDNESA